MPRPSPKVVSIERCWRTCEQEPHGLTINASFYGEVPQKNKTGQIRWFQRPTEMGVESGRKRGPICPDSTKKLQKRKSAAGTSAPDRGLLYKGLDHYWPSQPRRI